MSEAAEKTEEKAVVTLPQYAPPPALAHDDPLDLYFNPSMFSQLKAIGNLMAASKLVPKHLQDAPSDCFLICAQAFRWKLDPFAVAQHTFIVSGKLGYEGKLIAAIINARLGAPLDYEYEGEIGSVARTVKVTGRLPGTNKERFILGNVRDWKTGNDNWTKDPDQMLAYRGARTWARRYAPEIALGLIADDEIAEPAEPEIKDVTPAKSTKPAERLDAFAGKQNNGPAKQEPAADNKEAKPADAALFGLLRSVNGQGEAEVMDTATGEVVEAPRPTQDALDDFVKNKRWATYNKWLTAKLPALSEREAKIVYIRDRELIEAILGYGSNHKETIKKLFAEKGIKL